MGRVFDAMLEAQRRGGRSLQPPWDLAPIPEPEKIGELPFEPLATPGESPQIESAFLALHPKSEDRLVSLGSSVDIGAERFRILANQLRMAQKERKLRRVLITSSISDEGKSLVSVNLALSLAKYAGRRTLLLDADHWHATLTRLLQCQSFAGLREWVANGGPVWPFARRHPELPFWFVPTGARSAAPQLGLQVEALSARLEEAGDSFDCIIIDSLPALLADAMVWMDVADGCLIIARQGKTPKKMLQKTLASVPHSKMLGVVLNDCSDTAQKYYDRYGKNPLPKSC